MQKRGIIRFGSKNADVLYLQEQLLQTGILVPRNGVFDRQTEKAVIVFQISKSLKADGVVGKQTWSAFEKLRKPEKSSKKTASQTPETPADIFFSCGDISVDFKTVMQMCPNTSKTNVKKNLPLLLGNLVARDLGTEALIRMTIATVYVETGQFAPLSEYESKYNTSAAGNPFDLYDDRKDLGNRGFPDGERYKGRGFIQLTGRANYQTYGLKLGVDLENQPELANDPKIAAAVFCEYLKSKEGLFVKALRSGDLAKARKLVNGGSHGLDIFKKSYLAWEKQEKKEKSEKKTA